MGSQRCLHYVQGLHISMLDRVPALRGEVGTTHLLPLTKTLSAFDNHLQVEILVLANRVSLGKQLLQVDPTPSSRWPRHSELNSIIGGSLSHVLSGLRKKTDIAVLCMYIVDSCFVFCILMRYLCV